MAIVNRSLNQTVKTTQTTEDFYYHPSPQCHVFGQQPSTSKTYTVPLYSSSINSVNSVGYMKKKKVYVTFVPRKPLVKPVEPRLRLTALPVRPERRVGQTQRSFNRILKSYLGRKKSIEAKRSLQLKNYERAMKRYKNRLQAYAKYSAWASQGRPVFKRVINKLARTHNPYTKSVTYYQPLHGSITLHGIPYRHKCRTVSQVPFGQHNVQSMTHLSGYLEQYYPYTWKTTDSLIVSVTSASDSRARAKFREKLNKQQVHLGCLIAERKQTLSMLRNIMEAVLRMTPRQLLKRLIPGTKENANVTLAYLFGVKPLIEDAYGIGQALGRLSVGEPDKIVIHAKSSASDRDLVSSTPNLSGGYITHWIDMYQETTVTTHYVCEYTVDNGALTYLNGIGLINPAEVLWEVMPWSFVIDWFLPIGNYISALTSEAGVNFLTGSKTVKTTTVLTAVMRPNSSPHPSKGYPSMSGSATGSKVIRDQKRTVLKSTPWIELPSFKNPISGLRLAETFALLRQRF